MAAVEPLRDRKKVEQMLIHLEKTNYVGAIMARIGLNTSLRISDILNLKYEDVVNSDGQIKDHLTVYERKKHKVHPKTGKKIRPKGIKILIAPNLKKHLAEHIHRFALVPGDWICFDPLDPSRPVGRIKAWRWLKAAARTCNVENFGTHSLRKTFAYHTYRANGNDIYLVMNLLNHKDPEYTLRYIGITQEMKDKAVELINF